MSARKLRQYFEVHTIKVVTNQPLNDIFGNRDSSGRISKWAMDLSERIVDFEKCSAVKSQILESKEWFMSHHGSSVVTELGGSRSWSSHNTNITFRNQAV
jgi:hypothetical protein